jgi:pimeloyl-ACP methyl ester carboxylesterase
VPNLLEVFRQLALWDGPTADDPAVLRTISAPVLTLYGADTKSFWVRGAHHVAAHVPHARLRVVPSAGHAAPLTHPQALAAALTEFFSPGTPPA